MTTTLTPRTTCCRAWRRDPTSREDMSAHWCDLAPAHPGDQHQCGCCGAVKQLRPHADKRNLETA